MDGGNTGQKNHHVKTLHGTRPSYIATNKNKNKKQKLPIHIISPQKKKTIQSNITIELTN